MDLPDLSRSYYKGITYMLSDLFDTDYNDDYVINDDADTRIIYDINVNFSIEAFSKEEAETISYAFDDEIDLLNAVHDNYIIRRKESVYEFASSVKKELPSSVSYPGYIQVIHGSEYDESLGTTYFTATLEANGQYYVFQMIGKRENMGYLYDDFIDILSSVRG